MINLNQIGQKKSLAFYLKQLILFVVCALFFGIGAGAESPIDIPETYKVTLPQKVDGVQKLEYMMGQENMGNTAGTSSVDAAPGTKLSFLVQIESEEYSKLCSKDVKIQTESGQTLNLMKYMYDIDGNFIKVAIPENEPLDSKQTYITSDYNICCDDTIYLNKLNKDTFNTHIVADTKDYSLSEALDISCQIGKGNQTLSPIYNESENSFEINNIPVNSPIYLTINKNKDFSQSEVEIFNGENKLGISENGSVSIPAIKSDVNLTIKNIRKNKYNLSFKSYSDISFEYRKQGEEDFKSVSGEALSVISGGSVDFKCNCEDESTLENKEITANGIALRESDGVYSLLNIKEDTNINVNSKEESSYKISLPNTDSGVTATNESDETLDFANVKFGESFKFKLKANEGYDRNIENVSAYAVPTGKLVDNDYNVEANPEETSGYLLKSTSDGVFTVSEVKEPMSIIVKNAVKNTYRLNFPTEPGEVSYRVEPSEGVKEVSPNLFTVVHGSKVFVTLTAPDGKLLPDHSLGISIPGTTITKNGGTYTIENITDDADIVIGGAENRTCNITFNSEGIICKDENGHALGSNTLTANYKGSAKFKVDTKEGYKATNGISLSIAQGSASLTALSGENLFEISNVTDNVALSVKGVEKETVAVTLNSTGVDKPVFKSQSNEELPSKTEISYGNDLEFTVSSRDGSNQAYTVTSNDSNATIETIDASQNKFLLKGATANTTLSATPVYSSGSALNTATRGIASAATGTPLLGADNSQHGSNGIIILDGSDGSDDSDDSQTESYSGPALEIHPFRTLQLYNDPSYNNAASVNATITYTDKINPKNSKIISNVDISKPTKGVDELCNLKMAFKPNFDNPDKSLDNIWNKADGWDSKKLQTFIEAINGNTSLKFQSDFTLMVKLEGGTAPRFYKEQSKKYIVRDKNYIVSGFERFSGKYVPLIKNDNDNPDLSVDSRNGPYLNIPQDYINWSSDNSETNPEVFTMGGNFTGSYNNKTGLNNSYWGWSWDDRRLNYYCDNIVLNYDCAAPKYAPANITFTNSGLANFKTNSGEAFENNMTSIGAKNELRFKLYARESHLFNLAGLSTADKLSDATNAISVENDPSRTYRLVAIDYSSDGSYITYKIDNIINNNSENLVNLKLSVNNSKLERKKYTCSFTGTNATYSDSEGISIPSQKSFEYRSINDGEAEQSFIIKPGNIADINDKPKLSFKFGGGITENINISDLNLDNGASEIRYLCKTIESDNNTANLVIKIEKTKRAGQYKVTILQIKYGFTIDASYNKKKVTVKFYTDGNFNYKIIAPATLVGSEDGILPGANQTYAERQITHGRKVGFIVVPNDGFDISNIQVTANGNTVDLKNDCYTVSNITEETNIRVNNVSKITNDVTFTRYDNVFFKDSDNNQFAEKHSVDYNDDVSFRVSVSNAYDGSVGDIQIFAEYSKSGENVEIPKIYDQDENGNQKTTYHYTLEHVKENIRVYAKNMALNKYEITLNPTDGIEYWNEYGTKKLATKAGDNGKTVYKAEAYHGENFSFKVVAKTGYDISNLKVYSKPKSSNKSTQLLPSHDVYTINGISENQIVNAQNTPKSKCKLEFRTLPGATYTDPSGSTISNTLEVDYGSNYKFKISLDAAYNKSKPKVKIKGTTDFLKKGSDGNYEVSSIEEDKIIEIENVSKNTYTATFKDTEGVIYRTAKNKPFTGTQPVEYEGTLYFKISLMDAYDKSTPLVMLDDKKVLSENSGVYSISNIHDDVVVTVKNVVKNPEEVSISEILNVPKEVNTTDDVDAVVKATKTYMNLSDEDKEQVTNIDDLKKSQENAGRINHSSGDVEIAGVDWNIKLMVTPLTDNEEQMRSFEEKVDRRSLISLYEIHLIDLLSGNNYEVPYGQEVSVILPAPNLTGYSNAVVAHETSGGSMEYLDLNVVDYRAQFKTSSFSKFGIAAKKLENYVEDPSNMKISVNSLVENEEELKSLLGEGLVSQLGNLIDKTDEEPKKEEIGTVTDDSTSNEGSMEDVFGLKKVFDDAGMEETYNWILEHELIAVVSILLIGALLIWLLLALARKNQKEEEAKGKK